MERDFTHGLNLILTIQLANVKVSSIDVVISGLQCKQPEKEITSTVNTEFNLKRRSDYYKKTDLVDLYLTQSYEVQLEYISSN